jgi:large subunit ribosomal protein L4
MPKKITTPIKEEKTTANKLSVYDMKGVVSSELDIHQSIQKAEASPLLLGQYVRFYLAGKRQGTHSTKTRSEIVGTTKKMYRQKGTGRARHGSGKEPNFVGGGVAFGPKPKDYGISMNEKQKQRALLAALSLRFENNDVVCIDGMEKVTKTKEVQAMLNSLKITAKKNIVLVVPAKRSDSLVLASRNLQHVKLFNVNALNAYEILNAKKIIFTKEAFNELKIGK